MDQRLIVAWLFRIFAGVAGLPALAMLIKIGIDVIALKTAPPVEPSQHLDVQKYGLVALLSDGAQGLGTMLSLLSGVGMVAMVIIAVVSLLALLLGVLLFFTGNGIAHRAGWARGMGIALAGMFLLAWVGLSFAVDRSALPVSIMGSVVAAYMLWVLTTRYA